MTPSDNKLTVKEAVASGAVFGCAVLAVVLAWVGILAIGTLIIRWVWHL